MFVKAAINGGRPTTSTHAVPVTNDEIARDARLCTEMGANVVHAHVRTSAGAETISGAEVSRMVDAVKSLDSSIVIGTTTGLWTCDGHADRMAKVKSWANGTLPDFASAAYREEGADEVAGLILDLGMQLESAVWSHDDLERLLQSRYLQQNVRLLIEPEVADPIEAIRTCIDIAQTLRAAAPGIPLLFHGYDDSFWPVVELSIREGVQTRIGFEDTLLNYDGSAAKTNRDLFESFAGLLERHTLQDDLQWTK